MTSTTTIRVDVATVRELKRLAQQRQSTISETVNRAVRLLRQDDMGRQLGEPLDGAETEWLDAPLG